MTSVWVLLSLVQIWKTHLVFPAVSFFFFVFKISLMSMTMLGLQAQHGFYFVGKESSSLLKQKFQQLIGEEKACPQEVEVVMGRTLQVGAKICFARTYKVPLTCFWQLLKSNSIRFHWVPMDVRIFLLKNFVTNHLELQIILDYSVSHAQLNQFDLHIIHEKELILGAWICQMQLRLAFWDWEID